MFIRRIGLFTCIPWSRHGHGHACTISTCCDHGICKVSTKYPSACMSKHKYTLNPEKYHFQTTRNLNCCTARMDPQHSNVLFHFRVTIAGVVSNEMVSVYFCDYGDLALFTTKALRPVPLAAPLARTLPPQAIKARLYGKLYFLRGTEPLTSIKR